MHKILITAGGTSEPIDDVRVITNTATGTLGALTAEACAARGAAVTFVCAKNSVLPAAKAKIITVQSATDLQKTLSSLLKKEKFKAVVHSMAVSDYAPIKTKGKISSDKETLTITLKKTPKIINTIKKLAPQTTLLGFKLLSNTSEAKLISAAQKLFKTAACDYVFANDLKHITPQKHKGLLIAKDLKTKKTNTKQQAAKLIAEVILK